MTPAEKAVIEAARDYIQDENANGSLLMVLASAVERLDAERAATEDTRPWSQVVAEDEIYSTKTQKWYRVIETHQQDGKVMMRTEGMAKAKAMNPAARVRVRRSEMGQAVDVWAGLEVISS